MTTAASPLRLKFFEWLFGEQRGYVCIAYAPPTKSTFKQSFFDWPKQANSLEAFIDQVSHGNNVWFCTSLLEAPRRIKENALEGSLVWADFDGRAINEVEPSPSCIIQSSPGHFHLYWRMDKTVDPLIQEEYSRKVAYKYLGEGADKGGWDLTQLLRVPYTYNYKPEYATNGDHPYIEILNANEELIPLETFDDLYVAPQEEAKTDREMPNPLELPTVEKVLHEHWSRLSRNEPFKALFGDEPAEGDDWSKKLWRLLNICFETGMTEEETFVVASNAKCNKYQRDNRPISHLWKDVCKVFDINNRIRDKLRVEQIIVRFPDFEVDRSNEFISKYVNWASDVTDAPIAYHELCAVILLSSVLSSSIKFEVSWGELPTNLWGLILGGSTLTRKTTAMNMAKSILAQLDPDLIFASDASPEGLLTGLSLRPDRVSIFFRDEIAGFLQATRDKLYLASLPEILTQLYDVPDPFTRTLRKDTYVVSKPYFIFFGGGIKDKTFSLIDEQSITSGFIPRFLIVSGDTDAVGRKRTGPPAPVNLDGRTKIVNHLADLLDRYSVLATIRTPHGQHDITKKMTASLTTEAWETFGHYEFLLEEAAEQSAISDVALPMFTRQASSLLKMAVLFGAERQIPNSLGEFLVEKQDIEEAATYIQRWGKYVVEMLLSSGKSRFEKLVDKIFFAIRDTPGILQSELFRRFHLRAREGDDLIKTLAAQGLIYFERDGRSTRVYPILERA